MKLPHRRQFLHLAAGAAALPAVTRFARAQAYPARPVTLIVYLPAGATLDILARLIGQSLSQRFGQSVVIDNRPEYAPGQGIEKIVRNELFKEIWNEIERLDQGVSATRSATAQSSTAA